jgi:hypothetical protein
MKDLTKAFLQAFILTQIVFSVFVAHAVNVNYQVNDIYDDLWFSQVGTQWQTTPYIPLVQSSSDVTGVIAFRNLSIPAYATINTAILSLRTVQTDNYTLGDNLLVTIYGIRDPDIPSFSPPNNVVTLPITNNFVTWNVTEQNIDQWVNITVTNIVQEIVSLYGWSSGSNLGFEILSVADSPPRWFKAYDTIPSHSARLYITHSVNTPPQGGDQYEETYRNQTIWNRTTTANENLSITKLGEFDSYNDIEIDGAPWQRKILYSNVTDNWYVFYSSNSHPVFTGVTLYARFSRSGTLLSQDQIVWGGLATPFRDLHDFDVAINRQGTRIYLIASYDLDAGNNGFNNADKETLRWIAFRVNATTRELDQIATQVISDIALQPMSDIDRYENTQISVLPNGWQIISFGTKDGAVYSAWCMLNNLTDAWNLRYGFNPESVMVDLTAWNPSNVYYHTLNMGVFNETGLTFMLRARDAGFDWDYGGALVDNFVDEVNENAGYVYNGYTIANFESLGTDTGGNQDHFGALGRNSPTASYSYSGTIYSDLFHLAGRFETWVYNETDNDMNKDADIITTPLFYVLEYGYAFEDGNISMIYTDASNVWYGRNFNFNVPQWDNNYTIRQMNSIITDAKGRQDYGSSLYMFGFDGWDNYPLNVGGGLGVIDDTGAVGNYTLYLVDKGVADFRYIVIINGTEYTSGCLDLAYWNYQVHLNTTRYLEDVRACIDVALGGTDPQNPNPPSTNYQTGVFTRFGLRWLLLVIGFLLIFGTLSIMAWKTFAVHWYAMFIIMIVIGLGLLWSVATI